MIRLSRAACVLLLAAPCATALAQEVAPSPSPMPSVLASPAPDTRPVLELSLDDAVKRTLENNADLAVEKYNPESSQYNIRQFEGYYEPLLNSTVSQSGTYLIKVVNVSLGPLQFTVTATPLVCR